jgi:hypothetical protein
MVVPDWQYCQYREDENKAVEMAARRAQLKIDIALRRIQVPISFTG